MSLSALLDAIERTLSSALESGPLRLLRARLEPIHIVRELERLLDRHALVTAGGVVVPHQILARLNPADEARLSAVGRSLALDLATHLQRAARRRGRSFLGPVVVQLEADTNVPIGHVRSEVIPDGVPDTLDTAALPATSRLVVAPRSDSATLITLPNGETASFAQELISIGRGAENDVVIQDPQASRRHAEIHGGVGRLELRDLESTNGTWLNGARIESAMLSCPARVRIGGTEIQIDTLRV
jgi:hypothetical protein